MSTLPTGFAQLTLAFAPLFSKRVFQSVQVLLFGAILAIGKRTVTSVLRAMGLDQQAHFQSIIERSRLGEQLAHHRLYDTNHIVQLL